MTDFLALTPSNAELVAEVQRKWAGRVSYYFPLDASALAHTLFAQPEVHPATFAMLPEASTIAVEDGNPVGWVQAGYVSDIATIPDGQRDALVRGLMVDEGRRDVAAALLRRAIHALSSGEVRAWRAFEHSSGYTFAAGIGRVPHRMKAVLEALGERGFQPEETNLVYAARRLAPCPKAAQLGSIEVRIRPRGWSEPRANVEWDQFEFHERSEQVGYATVVPVRRLTADPDETTLFIKGIAVEPKHQRRGIGSLIMTTLWEHYHPHGIGRLLLNTGDDNEPAQRFYEAAGFDLTDRIASFIADDVTR